MLSLTSSRNVYSDPSRRRSSAKKDDEVDKGMMESRKFIAEHCVRNGGETRYAIKRLSAEVVADQGTFWLDRWISSPDTYNE